MEEEGDKEVEEEVEEEDEGGNREGKGPANRSMLEE